MAQFSVFRCAFCNGHLLEEKGRKLRSDKRYCSAKCRMAAKRERERLNRDIARTGRTIHDAVKNYYLNTQDTELQSDCREFTIGLVKLLKYELQSMNVDLAYSIKYTAKE